MKPIQVPMMRTAEKATMAVMAMSHMNTEKGSTAKPIMPKYRVSGIYTDFRIMSSRMAGKPRLREYLTKAGKRSI